MTIKIIQSYNQTSVTVCSWSESVLVPSSSNDMAAILWIAPRDRAAILLSRAEAVFCLEPGLLSRVERWLLLGYSLASPSSLLQLTEAMEIAELRLLRPRIGRRARLKK